MTRVIIAEKPSLARAIAEALPKPHRNCEGYIEAANGDIVTWCIGHLLEQVPPDAYDARYKRWSLLDLPIVPAAWKLVPRASAGKQLSVLRTLLKSAPPLVHAGDPDREGQLLVDEVINHLRYPQSKRREIKRLLISDLNLEAVRRALRELRPNQEFAPLSTSALARSRADWLYGMNMSRAYTLLGQRAGYQGVLSVGRVQTPVLGLVVRRDHEIEHFISKPFFEVRALIPHQGKDIVARWQPSEACSPYRDDQGRVLHQELAENVAARIANQPASITESKHKESSQAPPLPFSLSALQIAANRRYGLTAAAVLSACQALYEKHKAITYPRSDCRHLPEAHHTEASGIVVAIASCVPSLSAQAHASDTTLRSKAWNDTKVSAHHAIIPTASSLSITSCSTVESQVYQLIARQYLMQFYPPARYAEGKLVFRIAGGVFVAQGKRLLDAGWRSLVGKSEASDTTLAPQVPKLVVGSELLCREGEVVHKKTEAPKPFSEATLLQAMTGIARFVSDPKLRQILRETDGLGTEATRSGILEGLFRRCLLLREGKSIRSTDAGRGLIGALPESAAFPDMTAHWERQLADIALGKARYSSFMGALEEQVSTLMEHAKKCDPPESLRGLVAPSKNKRTKSKRSAKGGRKKRQMDIGQRRS